MRSLSNLFWFAVFVLLRSGPGAMYIKLIVDQKRPLGISEDKGECHEWTVQPLDEERINGQNAREIESLQSIWIFECAFSFWFDFKMLSSFLGITRSRRGGYRSRRASGTRLRREGYRSRRNRGTGVVFKINNLLAYACIFGTLAHVVLFK